MAGMCRLYSSCDLSDTTTSEAGWTNSTRNLRICILKTTKPVKSELVKVLMKKINSRVVEADILFFLTNDISLER